MLKKRGCSLKMERKGESYMLYKRIHMMQILLLLACALLLWGCAAGGQDMAASSGNAAATGQSTAVMDTPSETDAGLSQDVYPVNQPTGAESEIVVSTVDEFLAAIGPDRTVYLQKGEYDLTKALDYGQATASGYYAWNACYDGYELSVQGIQNLTIVGESATAVALETTPRYANVIAFHNCENISVQSVTAGHREGAGGCVGAVLYFEAVHGISVSDCELYGCGTLGLELWDCQDILAENCTIRACSMGAASLDGCRNAQLKNCRMRNCGTEDSPAFYMVYLGQSDAVAIVDCSVENNTCTRLMETHYSRDVQLLGSVIENNNVSDCAFALAQYGIIVEGCAFTDNEIPAWYADMPDSTVPAQATSLTGAALSGEDFLQMQQADIPYTAPASASTEPQAAASDEKREVHVSNVDELLSAIASHRTVYLADGVYDLSTASDYGTVGGDHYQWTSEFDGPGLVITGVEDFHIVGSGAEKVSVAAKPRYVYVLSYERCKNVSVTGVTLGHAEAPGECTGGVLQFTDTDAVSVGDCVLYGCGILGVSAQTCNGIAIDRTEIFDCSQGAAVFGDCKKVVFSNCDVHDCGEPTFLARYSEVTVNGEVIPSSGY